jgi:ubiquinone/menaquinone biosynthesis C-methylase UbiE
MWDKAFSKRFNAEEIIERKYLILSAMKEILEGKKWKRLIDLGCGSGYYSRVFASKNTKVVGVDRSETQLDIATKIEKEQGLGIEYIKSDLRKLRKIKSYTFDVALLVYVLMEISDKKTIGRILNEAHRVLKRGGILIIAQVHPFNFNRESSILTKTLSKKGDSYFVNGTPVITKALLKDGKYMVFGDDHHYTLEFLLNSLIEAGFALDSIKELSCNEKYPTHIIMVGEKKK